MADRPGEGGGSMKAVLSCFLLMALLGCCPPPVVVPAPCPPPPVFVKPVSRVSKLPADSPLEEVARAYAMDLAEALGYAAQLEAALDAYRPLPQRPPK